MRMNLFNRLLLSYLPIVFVISLSLLMMTYLTLNEMSKKSAARANELQLHNIMQAIDDAMRAIDDRMNREIIQNGQIRQFFQPLPPMQRQYADYQVAAELRKMAADNELIASVYLFRTDGREVLTPTAFTGIDDFGDKTFVGQQVGNLYPFRWGQRREFREQAYGKPINVVSLVKFASLSDRGMMVVNVSTGRIAALIRQMSGDKLNFVDLLDASGRLIASKDETANEPRAKQASSNKGKLLSEVTSDYTGWAIRSGTYKAGITEWVSALFYLWIGIGFAVIGLGTAWLIVVSRRHYLPIRTLTNRVAEFALQKRQQLNLDRKTDEVQYIEAAINNLLVESSLLQEENKMNLSYRKRHMFLSMLEGTFAANADEEELGKLGIAPACGAVVVALVQIDRFADFVERYTIADQQLLKQVVGTVLQEMVEHEPVRAWGEWINRQQLAVCYMWDGTAVTEPETVALGDKLCRWVRENLPFTVTIGVGAIRYGFDGCSPSYESAVEALRFKSSLGTNRVIGQADLHSLPQGEMFRQLQHIRAIGQLFRAGDSEWGRHFEQLHVEVRRQLFSQEDVSSLLHYLLYHLDKEMLELPAELQHIWHADIHERLQRVAAGSETADDLFNAFRSHMHEAFQRMNEQRDSKNTRQLMRKVKQFIGDHYARPDLSLQLLSDEFGLKAGYLSRLFKEEFGENFSDYLARERIDKALELLSRHSDHTVQTIAASVGYPNALTFIRTFKKYKGITPGQYRKDMGE